VRIHMLVDQCVSADRWIRQYSSANLAAANHMTELGGP